MNPLLIENDIIIFLKFTFNIHRNKIYILKDIPEFSNKRLIKRCIGIPGDTIQIDKGVYINGNLEKNDNLVIHRFKLSRSECSDFFIGIIGVHPYQIAATGVISVGLTRCEALDLRHSLSLSNTPSYKADTVRIPTLDIIRNNKKDTYERSNKLDQKTQKFSNDGDDKLYYFLGDNRFSSIDSRNFGLLSSNQITGKPILLIRFSRNNILPQTKIINR